MPLNHYLIVLLIGLMPARCLAAENLAYYSDYFSFAGRDTKGFVTFALDNNRGVDGTDYQAEHFGVLYDQTAGWVKLAGMGPYDNRRGVLERIPDSPAFQFEGQPEAGLTIRSKENLLTLKIDPLITHLSESGEKRIESWSSAGAELQWKGRRIRGRVICEHLVVQDWNRLTRFYFGTWNNFQGFYLALETGGPDTWRDLYLRSQGKGARRRTKGFVTAGDRPGEIRSSRFKASDKAFNFGFFRWPRQWRIQVQRIGAPDAAPGELTLRQISRQNEGNWIIGGFAMTVVQGELTSNGNTVPVVGFVELIK